MQLGFNCFMDTTRRCGFLISKEILLLEYKTESSQDQEKCKIESRKQGDVVTGLAFVLFAVFPKGDQTGKRGDQGTYAADVDTQQKLLVIVRKLGQQDRGGNIADELAGQHREQQGVFLQQEREH